MSSHDDMNAEIRRAAGRAPAEAPEGDAPQPPADIDQAVRGLPAEPGTDMNQTLRRAAGREPAWSYQELRRGTR